MDEPRLIPPLNDGIKPYYLIYRNGTIINKNTGKALIPHYNHNGYLQVSLMTETGRVFRKVHRLVLLVYDYNPNHEFLQGNHKDGIKSNCDISNLEWSTPKENKSHAIATNLSDGLIGENNPKSVISEYQALAISDMLIRGYDKEDILMVIPNANISIIREIAFGRTWKYLFSESVVNAMKHSYLNALTDLDRHSICSFYQDNDNKYSGYGSVSAIARDALSSLGLDITDRNFRIAKRLYYRYDSPEITCNYKYGKFND